MCADCRVIARYAALSGSRAVLSPNCAPQKQKNWRSSCASECGSGTLQCRCMLRPQPGQRGDAVGHPDSVLLGIVLMSNLMATFCTSLHAKCQSPFGHCFVRCLPKKCQPFGRELNRG